MMDFACYYYDLGLFHIFTRCTRIGVKQFNKMAKFLHQSTFISSPASLSVYENEQDVYST